MELYTSLKVRWLLHYNGRHRNCLGCVILKKRLAEVFDLCHFIFTACKLKKNLSLSNTTWVVSTRCSDGDQSSTS